MILPSLTISQLSIAWFLRDCTLQGGWELRKPGLPLEFLGLPGTRFIEFSGSESCRKTGYTMVFAGIKLPVFLRNTMIDHGTWGFPIKTNSPYVEVIGARCTFDQTLQVRNLLSTWKWPQWTLSGCGAEHGKPEGHGRRPSRVFVWKSSPRWLGDGSKHVKTYIYILLP